MESGEWMGFLSENWEVALTVGSALIALVGAVGSRIETGRQKKLQMQALRAQVDKASVDWGGEAIDLLSEAGALADLCRSSLPNDQIEIRKSELTAKLSSLVDRGRLFFPNIDPASKGAEKEGAYRGHRPPILDAVMYAFYEVQSISRNEGPSPQDSANFIFDCRRLLVSELQAHLDPRRQDEIVERYDSQRRKHRDEALDIAGRLGLTLDARRPGLLTRIGDKGWMDRIGPEERKTILQNVHESQSAA